MKDGKEHGEYKRWYANGQLKMHCYMIDGKEEGECKMWYEDGNLQLSIFMKNGVHVVPDPIPQPPARVVQPENTAQ
eukprot:CAMPEP_0168523204 /NCGR_PEP_ID=MMETSP0405-20121227/9834_1 /TAXON_ID=498012 /ORGANISM="Trichosphaerium sp, Strain Am-I-7 wt" /LENGTH=75 /DNA_ID=CAMNT_0008545013 /DNA_START=430 /DNA_END=657 /DNA_ORIENTATION=+